MPARWCLGTAMVARAAVSILLVAFAAACRGNTAPPSNEASSTPAANTPAGACDDATARFVGRMYYETSAANEQMTPDAVERFVVQNGFRLAPDTAVMECARTAGTYLSTADISFFEGATPDGAYQHARDGGASIQDAERVRASFTERRVSLSETGAELTWLTEVLPSAATGNWDPFMKSQVTGRRQTIRQAWPAYARMQSLDPSQRGTLETLFAQYQPWLQYQVAFLVSRTPRTSQTP